MTFVQKLPSLQEQKRTAFFSLNNDIHTLAIVAFKGS